MKEDNLNPSKGNSNPRWFRMLMNNRGEVGGEGEGGEGEGDAGAGGEGAGAGAGGTAVADWRESLDPSIRDHPSIANFKTPAEVAKSYVNAQHLIGKEKIPIPSKDSNPMEDGKRQDWDMVYDRLGRPSDPKAYELPVVEGSPEIPESISTSLKAEAHKLGLLPHQLSGIVKWNQEQAMAAGMQNQTQLTENLQQSEAGMRKEYGAAFDSNIASAKNIIAKFGGKEVAEALDRTGAGNDPAIIRMMVKISKQFGEDGNMSNGEVNQSGMLSPDEAKAEIDKIKSDRAGAYWNSEKKFTDGEHKAMVQKVANLFEMANPAKV